MTSCSNIYKHVQIMVNWSNSQTTLLFPKLQLFSFGLLSNIAFTQTQHFHQHLEPFGKKLCSEIAPLPAFLFQLHVGHGSDVHKVKFSSDGTWLVTVSFDSLARLWKLSTGKCVHVTWAWLRVWKGVDLGFVRCKV